MKTILIDGQSLTIAQVCRAATHNAPVEIDPSAFTRIDESRAFVERILQDGKAYYGINTGFGAFENVRIPPHDLKQLQVNLVRSHSAGVGEPLPAPVVRAMLLLRANALCRGNSGVRRSVIDAMLAMLNRGIHPVIPSRGSVGASGDLAPLAHMTLALIGEGDVEWGGRIMPAAEAFQEAGLAPVGLLEKEGLALINGTQMMTGIGCIAAGDARNLLKAADSIGALSLEVLNGTDTAFIPQVHEARPHRGQVETARNMAALLSGSEIVQSHRGCSKVQDAYSLRCIPAVHGAARESLRFACEILSTEINSSVDNPLLFPGDGLVVSGGNFHGAPVALALETLTLGLSFIANISERRVERMVNRHYSGLPPFLARDGGLNSGLMIAHYTAAALASENKVLCHPACCDTIPTSAGQEDHVSMGSISALKLLKVLENTWNILAVEALTACEAMEHRLPLKPGAGSGLVYRQVRDMIPPLKEDRFIGKDISKTLEVIRNEGFTGLIEEKTGIF